MLRLFRGAVKAVPDNVKSETERQVFSMAEHLWRFRGIMKEESKMEYKGRVQFRTALLDAMRDNDQIALRAAHSILQNQIIKATDAIGAKMKKISVRAAALPPEPYVRCYEQLEGRLVDCMESLAAGRGRKSAQQ